ncbi:CoB--CoM heterodisulfide reductase subunit A [gamma proteobacterium IMCC2047]|nr:CoB--CoM heterodisulfide reductase subunit A [gamma proteobacterium IMCC2047]
MKFLFILFVVMPVAEITLLIKVGQQIGALYTAGLVVFTALVGSVMLRQQGLSTLFRAQERMSSGQIPLQEMLEGIFLAVGGALLITPGFITDVFGFLCLIPVTRKALVRLAGKHIKVQSAATMHQTHFSHMHGSADFQQGHSDGPIEGEFQRDDAPESDPTKKISKS